MKAFTAFPRLVPAPASQEDSSCPENLDVFYWLLLYFVKRQAGSASPH